MKHLLPFKLIIATYILLNSITGFSATIYVDLNATGANNGTSWANAYTSLEWATAFANSGDDIWVAKGTYYTSTFNDPNNTYVLNDGVNLYGNFAGTETSIAQRVDLVPDSTGVDRINETILSGDIGVLGDNSDNAYRIMYLVGNTLPITIDGVKIVGGNSYAGVVQAQGAGIFVQNSGDVNLANVIISDNLCQAQSSGGGAGIYLDNCTSLTVNNTVIRDNETIDHPTYSTSGYFLTGCGISSNAGSMSIYNSTIINNNITTSYGSIRGGGVYFSDFTGADMIVDNSFIGNNTLTKNGSGFIYGGGIFFQGGSNNDAQLTILNSKVNNSTLVTNSPGNSGATEGGGVLFYGDTLRITDSEMNYNSLTGNIWAYGGGLNIDYAKKAFINGSSFNYNNIDAQTNWGGGVFIDGSGDPDNIEIDDSQFSYNTIQSSAYHSSYGRGVGLCTETPTIVTNSDFSNNAVNISAHRTNATASSEASGYGGGIYSYSSIDIDNSTFHNNTMVTHLIYGIENYFTFPSELSVSYGGGVYTRGYFNIQNSTFYNNIHESTMIATYAGYACRAYSKGAGVYAGISINLSNPPSVISNCEFVGNETESIADGDVNRSETRGAGICVENTSTNHEVHIDNCIVNTNKITMHDPYTPITEGGGIYFSGSGHIFESDISYNEASATDGDVLGGGVYIGDDAEIASCLIDNNSVQSADKANGGGIYNTGTSVMSNLTVAENQATSTIGSEDGAGVYNNANTSLYNSIVYYNETTNNYFGQASYLPFNCIIQSFPNGATNFNIPPFFVNAAADDFHIASNSIGINNGDNTYIPLSSTLDLDGSPRILNSTVDIGAYERDPCADQVILTESICQGDSYFFDGQNLTTAGVYRDTLQNIALCDSVITLNLIVNDANTSSNTLAACGSYLWNGTTYSASGIYTWTGTNVGGCDSVATLDLTINTPNTSTNSASECDSYLWNGTTYTASGSYSWTGTNVNGCDSVATLNLTINNSNTSTNSASACDSYLWNGTTYTASGNYSWTGTNAAGCDSIATLNLTISNNNSGSDNVTACNTYTWSANSTTYTTSGAYTTTLTNIGGCDSIATLNLTINTNNSGSANLTACNSYTWSANSTTYTTSGSYTSTLTNIDGCDSIATLNLTINYSNTGSDNVTACNSYTWPANSTAYIISGIYTATLTNVDGCDSIATLNLTINNSNSGSENVTACNVYTWSANSTTYTASGNYSATLTNVDGCDSIATLNLTINNSNSGSENITACNTYTWSANSTTYTAGGTYSTTLTNTDGCDSIATLNLTINNSNSGFENVTSCDTYFWSANANTYTSSGSYTATLTNTDGCDSIATLNLTINNSNSGSENLTACNTYTWSANSTTYTANGVYTATLTNINGCDSIATLNLTISNSITGSDNITACETYTWSANSITYTTSGSYSATLTSVNGCDSIATLNLTISNNTAGSESITACNSYTWSANSTTYTAGGVYTASLTSIDGCDSIATLNLTITNSNSGSESITACETYTWSANAVTYSASGVYTASLTNQAGCDSIATLNLTINNSNSGSENVTACATYTWSANSITYTSSGLYTATLTNLAGCDSIATLNLTISNSNSGFANVTACDSYTWADNSTTYITSGTYMTTLTNTDGCDSIATLNLTINNSNSSSSDVAVCDTYTWAANSTTYTTSGTYSVTFTNASGCDSTSILNLTINNSNSGSENVTACETYIWSANSTTYTASGVYTETLTNSNGCDSIATLNLTINNSNSGSENITVCDTYTWSANGTTYTASGTYTATLTNSAGCDSVATLNLTVNLSSSGSENVTVCDTYTWSANSTTYTMSGSYTATLMNTVGCDSIATLNLTVNTVNIGTTLIDDVTIQSDAVGAIYKWLDCNNNYSAIAGETSQSYMATVNGNYAAEITQNGCVDTTDCIVISNVGIKDIDFGNDLVVYPNPTFGNLKIDLGQTYLGTTLILYDAIGRVVINTAFGTTDEINIEIEGAPGMYILEIRTENGKAARLNVIKE